MKSLFKHCSWVLGLGLWALIPSSSHAARETREDVAKTGERQIRQLVEPLLERYCQVDASGLPACKLLQVSVDVDLESSSALAPGFDELDPRSALKLTPTQASVRVLIDEQMAKDPVRLADYLKASPISVWYSAPSILAMMVEHGGLATPLPEQPLPWPGPRITLFAGEVFPVAPLKLLRMCWPSSSFWNLYGPTETNVCTAYKAPASLENLASPLPIGPVCTPLEARIVDAEGADVNLGEKGELVIYGPRVMAGYFGRDDLTNAAFFTTADGRLWYRTGDLVVDDGTGNFIFHGRRDRMVKKRGYRIELGEIESALYRNDGIQRAAVVAIPSETSGLRIAAFVAMKPDRPASIIAVKRHCSTHLPQYMIPDDIKFLPELPTTSTDKIDYPALKKIIGLVA